MRALLRWIGRLRPSLLGLVAALLAGLLVHIGTVLSLTHIGAAPGYLALSKLSSTNQMTVLEPVSAGHQPLPFMAPSERYAICRFDLRKGPVAINVKLGGDDWMVAVYSPNGDNVYAISGADLARHDVEIVLASRDDGLGAALPIARDGNVTTSVSLASRTGIAVVSAPVARAANGPVAEQLLGQATCTQQMRVQG